MFSQNICSSFVPINDVDICKCGHNQEIHYQKIGYCKDESCKGKCQKYEHIGLKNVKCILCGKTAASHSLPALESLNKLGSLGYSINQQDNKLVDKSNNMDEEIENEKMDKREEENNNKINSNDDIVEFQTSDEIQKIYLNPKSVLRDAGTINNLIGRKRNQYYCTLLAKRIKEQWSTKKLFDELGQNKEDIESTEKAKMILNTSMNESSITNKSIELQEKSLDKEKDNVLPYVSMKEMIKTNYWQKKNDSSNDTGLSDITENKINNINNNINMLCEGATKIDINNVLEELNKNDKNTFIGISRMIEEAKNKINNEECLIDEIGALCKRLGAYIEAKQNIDKLTINDDIFNNIDEALLVGLTYHASYKVDCPNYMLNRNADYTTEQINIPKLSQTLVKEPSLIECIFEEMNLKEADTKEEPEPIIVPIPVALNSEIKDSAKIRKIDPREEYFNLYKLLPPSTSL